MNEERQNSTKDTEQLKDSHELTEDSRKIAQLEEQVATLHDNWLRSMAECQNVRNRASSDVQAAREYAVTSFAKEITNVIDSLKLALGHVPDNQDPKIKALFEGVQMTYNELQSILKRHGVTPIEPKKGETFDHNRHSAISLVATGDVPDGAIFDVMQPGYMINERVLRPATVVIAKAAS